MKRIILLTAFAALLISCQTDHPKQPITPEPGMIKVTILYPNEAGKSFDMDYYEQHHMPMMAGFLGSNLKFYEIDKGIGGRTAGEEAPYVAIGYFYCADLAEYNRAVGANIEVIRGDLPKYTDIQPVIQVSEIRQVKYQAAE